MNRLSIMVRISLGILAGLTVPAVADRCPPLPIEDGQFCDCIIWNYSTYNDTGVTITVFYPGAPAGGVKAAPTVPAGSWMSFGGLATNHGYCACTVVGEVGYSLTTLAVEGSFSDYTPIAAVRCH